MPFAFVTEQKSDRLPHAFRKIPIVSKPRRAVQIVEVSAFMIATANGHHQLSNMMEGMLPTSGDLRGFPRRLGAAPPATWSTRLLDRLLARLHYRRPCA